MHDESEHGARAWKGFDWDTMNRLHEKGFIGNPVGKAKSVVMTPEGCRKAKELFEKLFVKQRIEKNVGEQVGACLKRG
jgi:hypothetical protein